MAYHIVSGVKNKLELINKDSDITNLKVGAICWVDLGYNVGTN